jgi:hypothetical protein
LYSEYNHIMDYRYLCRQLMRTYQQLVIFDLKEVDEKGIHVSQQPALVYDLTTQNTVKKKYFIGNHNCKPIVVILEDLTTGVEYQDYLTTIYNLYGCLIRQQKQMINYEQMEQLASHLPESSRQIHWIWFREKGFTLPDKIMMRAKSWIELNPNFKLYLWTNLLDSTELDDFISQLRPDNRQPFTDGIIIVKYQQDVTDIIKRFCCLHESRLDPNVSSVLDQLYSRSQSVTTATTNCVNTTSHNVLTTIIKTETPNTYKINRIFKTDMLRVIILNMCGGIYCDFNDTICFYPMKYLLTFYPDDYFVGTDFDLEHPIFRNNFLVYNSFGNLEFLELGLTCVNKAVREYQRITSQEFMNQYYLLCLDFLTALNQAQTPLNLDQPTLVSLFLQLPRLKEIIAQDHLKDPYRVINLVAEICGYFGAQIQHLQLINQRLLEELKCVDQNALRNYVVRYKATRRRNALHRRGCDQTITVPITYDHELMDQMITTYEFRDYFLIKYAVVMTIGDLILSTNISYISEIPNLIPYARSNRLSTISMMTHIYDGTSYGLTKQYETIDSKTQDLRTLLL